MASPTKPLTDEPLAAQTEPAETATADDTKKGRHDEMEAEDFAVGPSFKETHINELQDLNTSLSKQDEGDIKPPVADDSSEDEEPPDTIKLEFAKPQPELNAEDSAKFREANHRRVKDDRAMRLAHSKLLKAKADAAKAQAKFEECQRVYTETKNRAKVNIERDATSLLLEPTSWNTYYRHLLYFYDRNGHCNIKRTITEADVVGLSEEAARELRTLSWWTYRQRKLKRRGELEGYKVHLLNQINFEWNPHAGPEKWMKSFNLLKDYKHKNGHVKVPIKHIEQGVKLGSWLKTQVTQYRNAEEGRQPALCAERIRMLEEIGIEWGEKRLTTSWNARFEDLLAFKSRYGHVNVPWQWKENVSLAQWVNSQRKKYKDLGDGKRNNLSSDQITRLNGIGFKWSTGGKGRYHHDTDSNNGPVEPEQHAVNVPGPVNRDLGANVPSLNFPSESSPSRLEQPYPHSQYFNPQLAQQTYLQYTYHMNQLNNYFSNPHMRGQMNHMYASSANGDSMANGHSSFAGNSSNASHQDDSTYSAS